MEGKIKERIDFFLNVLMGGIACLAAISLILEYGFYLSPPYRDFLHRIDVLIVSVFILGFGLRFFLAPQKKRFFSSHWIESLLILLLLLSLYTVRRLAHLPEFLDFLESLRIYSVTKAYIVVAQIYLLLTLILKAVRGGRYLAYLKFRPPQLVIFTYLIIIGVGTSLLLLPRASAKGGLSFLDALFTSTSATCVTGLIVVNTGSHFSLLGQLIILSLIQIGGLGLMTFTSFFTLLFLGEFGVRERVLLGDVLHYKVMNRLGSLVLSILLFTFTIEILGTLFLYPYFLEEKGEVFSAFYFSLFHSISAFCNAGFSLFSGSFERFKSVSGVNLIMTTLIILGGLGFIVLRELLEVFLKILRKERVKLSLQSKLVLLTSLILLGVGTFFILGVENSGALKGLSGREKLLASWFQSVTSRTAGFNTIPIKSFSYSASFLLILFMFIGASPGSTGGGIKTSTFATLLITVRSFLKGKTKVEVFHRTIPSGVVQQAIAVFVLGAGWVAISTLLLTLTEKGPFLDILFEDLSAFGTVGLSRGITRSLTPWGKLIIIITMLGGRIGPLTLALAMGGKKIKEIYRYPEENIMIG